MSNAEPGVLDDLTIVGLALNEGPLEVGSVVDALVDDTIQSGLIIQVLNENLYKISLWNIVSKVGSRYEEGFRTRDMIVRDLRRSQLFARGSKCHQEISQQVGYLCTCGLRLLLRPSPHSCYGCHQIVVSVLHAYLLSIS
jgi:hypothetical protein